MYLRSSLLALVAVASSHANPIITEFMADNTTTIADDGGAFSDWIEIHNPTSTPLNLNQWCLTDDVAEPAKWRFPAVVLEPGGFLIVWASGKNHVNPAAPLHTNFSLAAGGEYLALVQPDGTTVEQQFAPKYPAQQPNEAYGLQFTNTSLLAPGAAVKYQVPTSGADGTAWKDSGFDDSGWSDGTTGLGFGILTPGISVRDVKKASGLVLSLANADALLAGTGIASETTVVLPKLNLLGDGGDGHYAAGNSPYPNGGGDNFAIKATGFVQIPTAGTYSFGLSSSEGGRIRIDGADVMVDNTNHGPSDHIGSVALTAGMHTFEVVYWEASNGEELEFYARAGTPIATNAWDGVFKLVGDTANGGLAAFTTPSGSGGGIGTNMQTAMQNINATCYFRGAFAAAGPGTFTSLSLKMRYADGFIAYLNGAEIASKNIPGSPQWDSAATATRTASQAIVPESVNISSLLPSLINGNNVLAVHAMNNSTADGVFFSLPELIAGKVDTISQSVFYGGGLATPGAMNGAYSLLGKVSDTQFSVNRGFFTTSFPLEITSLTPGVTIRYTTNGARPTATTGTIYTGPINITGTTVIRAAAYKTGWESTDVDTQTYLFLNDVITQSAAGTPPPGWPASSGTSQILDYGMDPDIVNSADPNIGGATQVKNALTAISTICITTELSNLFNINGSQGIYSNPGNRGFAWERPAAVEMINPPSAGFPNGTSEFQAGVGIRVRGGYSRDPSNPKHGWHLYFREDYGDPKLTYPLFGRRGTDEFDQIDLRTSENYSWSFGGDGNNTFMREESTRLAQLSMGQESGRLRYFHLYINGIYWGLFDTEERTEASYSATYFGGDKDDYDVVKNAGNAGGYQTEVTDGNFTAWQNLWNQGRAHKTNPTNANYYKMQGLAADGVTPTADPVLLDVDNLIDYMLLTFWTGNLDGSTSNFLGNHTSNNWFGSRNRLGTKGGFRFFAHDFEHTFFNTGEDRTGPYTGVNDANFAHSSPMFLHQDLSTNAEFRMRWADRIHKHMFNNGALSQAAWSTRWTGLANIVDSVIIAESARWGDSKTGVPLNRNNWISAKNSLMAYPPARIPNVLSQLRGDNLYPTLDAPGMAPFGGYVNNNSEVVMTNNGGTIYYMPDGSDPRAIGGAIRPGALIYTSSTSSDTLIALGSTWKYLADGSNQGTAWKNIGFNDASWTSGATELGYGDGDEVLPAVPFVDVDTVTAGVQKNATTYFRKTFTATNVSGITALNLSLEYDDAAVVYLNGKSVAVTPNITAGVAYDYYSGPAIEDTVAAYSLNVADLSEGTNTIAVEVHQSGNGSSDISFNLSLTATKTSSGTPFFITGAGERPFKVRANNAGTWSALVDATFLIDTEPASASNLVISEIMYHPADPTASEANAGFANSDDFEYIELTNIGPKHVDLLDVYFYGAIRFNFTGALTGRTLAPGGRVIVAANKTAFDLRYGAGKPVAGSYKGNLGNGGETVQLFFPNDTVLRSVTYTDLAPWPTEADGTGYSLVLKRPFTNPNSTQPANWRASATLGGAPGAVDSNTLAAFYTANGVSNPNADEDQDTLNDLQEYALGGNPNANSQAQMPVVGQSGGYATLTFTHPIANDDIAYSVEGSTDVTNAATWNSANAVFVSATKNGNGTITEVYRCIDPLNGATRQFLRLRTTLLP